jgi:antitoxin component of MazEF toxin-antitoxin module
MIKRLTRHGNSLALVIDRGILELLRIDAKTPLSITTDGRALVIAPAADDQRRNRFRRILEEGNRRYGRMLKRLSE